MKDIASAKGATNSVVPVHVGVNRMQDTQTGHIQPVPGHNRREPC